MTDDIDLDAAEYVLGTLDASERAAFAARLLNDSAARFAVAGWEQRLAGLAGHVGTVEPSATVWPRIEQALATTSGRPQAFAVVEGGASTLSPRIKASRDRWRAAAIFSGSIAAALLVFVAQRGIATAGRDPGDISYIAAVNRGGDKPALLIRVDLKTRQVFVRPVAAETPAGHSLELWFIGDEKPPRSMGLVEKTPATLSVPNGTSIGAATFAVSVEPPGGSKSGSPTGPVVYAGQLVKE
jgi:anti-sigma-K factor RskA